jgi:hypothetical protein
MSTPLFLLASLGCALGLAGLGLLIRLIRRSIAPSVGTLHQRWLERRLRRRLARGEDNYFEELRSIEVALARVPETAAPRSPIDRILFGAAIYLFGLVTLAFFLPVDARPAWTRRASSLVFVMLGLQYAGGMGATIDNPRHGTRIIGIVMIVLGSLMFAYDLYRIQRVAA